MNDLTSAIFTAIVILACCAAVSDLLGEEKQN